jgi:predicted RNA-binding protein with EMAP domain
MKDNIELINEIEKDIITLIYLIPEDLSNTERVYEIKNYFMIKRRDLK